MSGPASRSPRATERGEVSWVTLLLLVILGVGGYLGWIWVPVWYEQYVVKQTVRDFMNQAISNPHDDTQRRMLAHRLQSIASVEVPGESGEPVRRPAIVVDERDIVWERTAGEGTTPALRVAFEYERPVKYPGLNRVEVKVFQIDMTADLLRANWGSAR